MGKITKVRDVQKLARVMEAMKKALPEVRERGTISGADAKAMNLAILLYTLKLNNIAGVVASAEDPQVFVGADVSTSGQGVFKPVAVYK